MLCLLLPLLLLQVALLPRPELGATCHQPHQAQQVQDANAHPHLPSSASSTSLAMDGVPSKQPSTLAYPRAPEKLHCAFC